MPPTPHARTHTFFSPSLFPNAVLEVQFDPVGYTVLEGGDASLIVVLSTEAAMDVTVYIETMPGSAGTHVTSDRWNGLCPLKP